MKILDQIKFAFDIGSYQIINWSKWSFQEFEIEYNAYYIQVYLGILFKYEKQQTQSLVEKKFSRMILFYYVFILNQKYTWLE